MMAQRPGAAALILAGLVAGFLLLPLVAIVPISFTPARFLTLPHGTLSLIHYRELIDNPDWGQAILLSLRIGIVTSLVATGLALFFTLGIWMFQPPFATLLVGFVLPADGRAAGRLGHDALFPADRACRRSAGLVGYDSWLGVTLAHVVMTVPFAVVLILVALSQVDRRIDLAARGLGASCDAARGFASCCPTSSSACSPRP